ncbi:hypothetical protein [Candidatus Thiodiazotropha sp. LNASS1]|uniref:hypothetical protein n=1 Tax=Candidatus Thiodiazotropha sp. LNASS1 TaxID=3096260 RepID=UPI0034DE7617
MVSRTSSRMMTIAHAEFLRSLSPLKQHYQIEIDEARREVEISCRGLRAVLQLHEMGPVKLGSLTMPSLKVFFRFEDSAVDEISQFWARFDLCFRRGGG